MGANILHNLTHKEKPETLSSNPEKDEKKKNQDIKNIILKTQIETDELKKEKALEKFEELDIKDYEKTAQYDLDGNIYFYGISGEYIKDRIASLKKISEINRLEQKNAKEIIGVLQKQNDQRNLFSEIISVWRSKAYEVSNSFWFDRKKTDKDGMRVSGWRDDANTITNKINEINELIGMINLPIKQEIFDAQIKEIFKNIFEAEEAEDIIGNSDMKNIYRIFLDPKIDFKDKEYQILNIMRYGGWSGNTDGVKDIVADKVLQEKGFEKLKELLDAEKFTQFFHLLEKGDEIDLQNFLENTLGKEFVRTSGSLFDSLAKNCLDEYEDINDKTEETFEANEETYKKEYPKQIEKLKKQKADIIKQNKQIEIDNKIRKKEGKKLIPLIKIPKELKEFDESKYTFEEYKKAVIYSNNLFKANKIFKHFFIRQILEKEEYRGNQEKSFKGIYADMSGLAENKGWKDNFDIGDDKIDLAIDIGSTLAIGLMTMGAGMLATTGTRMILSATGIEDLLVASRIAKIGKYEKFVFAEKTFEGGYASHMVGNAFLEGLMFHEGANLMGNLMMGDENTSIWHGAGDIKEISKSILFMGALNGLHFQARLLGLNKNVLNFSEINVLRANQMLDKLAPKVLLSPEIAKKMITVSLSGAEMYGLSLLTDVAFGAGWHPTLRGYIEFVALLQVMKLKDVKKENVGKILNNIGIKNPKFKLPKIKN